MAEQQTTWAEAERFAQSVLFEHDQELQEQFQLQLQQMNHALLHEQEQRALLHVQNVRQQSEIEACYRQVRAMQKSDEAEVMEQTIHLQNALHTVQSESASEKAVISLLREQL